MTKHTVKTSPNKSLSTKPAIMKAARNYFFGAKKPTLANEDGWTLTGYGTPKLLEKLYRTGESIGARSVHGTVKKLSNNKFVIKKIPFTNKNQEHSFNTEVKVGSKPRIAEVGTRVFAFRSTSCYQGRRHTTDPLRKQHALCEQRS